MAVVTYQEKQVDIAEGDSVLEGLEKAGFAIPNSCRAGLCHSCMLKADGNIPSKAQSGLSPSQIAQDYFLACSCYPESDLTVYPREHSDLYVATVTGHKLLNSSVLSLTLKVDFSWFPGQFINLWKDETTSRSYSIASRCDENKEVELHIKRHEQGVVSQWLHDDISLNDELSLSSPLGDCFYGEGHHDKPILMGCTGTGLAPLYGILHEALAQGHTQPIYLYMASREPSGLYYREELQVIATENDNVHYVATVRRDAEGDILQEDLLDIVKERHPDLNGHKVFACGAPEFVKKFQRQCFFQGASISDILVDAFT